MKCQTLGKADLLVPLQPNTPSRDRRSRVRQHITRGVHSLIPCVSKATPIEWSTASYSTAQCIRPSRHPSIHYTAHPTCTISLLPSHWHQQYYPSYVVVPFGVFPPSVTPSSIDLQSAGLDENCCLFTIDVQDRFRGLGHHNLQGVC